MKYSVFYRTAVLMAVFFVHNTALAQPGKLGNWYALNVTYKPNKQFSFFTELETRSQLLTNDFFYHEAKAGVGYSLPKKIALLFAVSDCRTYTFPGNFKDLQTKEFRMWEQLAVNSYIGRLRVEHRYRIEQRWLDNEYRNRLRYRCNPVVPVNGKTVAPHVLYATVYDEVFFTDKAPYFEGNRFFAGAGYLFSGAVALQAGFQRQYNYHKTDDGSGKNFIQTSLQFLIDKSSVQHADKHLPVTN